MKRIKNEKAIHCRYRCRWCGFLYSFALYLLYFNYCAYRLKRYFTWIENYMLFFFLKKKVLNSEVFQCSKYTLTSIKMYTYTHKHSRIFFMNQKKLCKKIKNCNINRTLQNLYKARRLFT